MSQNDLHLSGPWATRLLGSHELNLCGGEGSSTDARSLATCSHCQEVAESAVGGTSLAVAFPVDLSPLATAARGFRGEVFSGR